MIFDDKIIYHGLDKERFDLAKENSEYLSTKKNERESISTISQYEYVSLENMTSNKWLFYVLNSYWINPKKDKIKNIDSLYSEYLMSDYEKYSVTEKDYRYYLTKEVEFKTWNEYEFGEIGFPDNSLSKLNWEKICLMTNNSCYLLGIDYPMETYLNDLYYKFYRKNYNKEIQNFNIRIKKMTKSKYFKEENLKYAFFDYIFNNDRLNHLALPCYYDHKNLRFTKNHFFDLTKEECSLDLETNFDFNLELFKEITDGEDMTYLILRELMTDLKRFYLDWAIKDIKKICKDHKMFIDLKHSYVKGHSVLDYLIPGFSLNSANINFLVKSINRKFESNYSLVSRETDKPCFYIIDPNQKSGNPVIDTKSLKKLSDLYELEVNNFSKFYFTDEAINSFEKKLKKSIKTSSNSRTKSDFKADRSHQYQDMFNDAERDFFTLLLSIIIKKHKLPDVFKPSNWSLSSNYLNSKHVVEYLKFQKIN